MKYKYETPKEILLFLTQLEFRGAGQGMGGQWSAAAQVDLGKTFSLFIETQCFSMENSLLPSESDCSRSGEGEAEVPLCAWKALAR